MALLACQIGVARAANPPSEPNGATYEALLREGTDAVRANRPADALKALDQIDEHYKAAYRGDRKVFCSHKADETLVYMTKSAVQNHSAVAISGVWCDAIYLKAYVLIDLNRLDEAALELDRALELAPEYPQYLNEKGHLLSVRRQWDEAIAMFKRAEQDHAYSSSPADSLALQTRACRGIGYALTEERKLDEAEANYRRCLTINPGDEKSKGELRYISQLRKSR
jgi:tetratricopeptide (TPR) repeat protein